MWEEYLYWHNTNKKILDKINTLIKDIERNGVLKEFDKPEALKWDYLRRINNKHRLVYFTGKEHNFIVACKTHYKDK